jgi:hypothetical protein
MELTETTTDLNDALQDMLQKGRVVNDSLKTLAEQGIARLSDALQKASTSGTAASRRPESDIIQSELQKLLRQEVLSSLAGIFGTGQAQGPAPATNGLNVVINNNAQATVSAAERVDAFNQRTLEISIDQMVADSLLRGRQTTGVMRALFGLVPTLIGR